MSAEFSAELSAKLLEAVNKNNLKDVKHLLRQMQQRGVNPAYDNNAALRAAVKNRKADIVKRLLQEEEVRQIANANPNEALRFAAKNKDKEIVKMLLMLPIVRKNVPDNNNQALRSMISHSKDDGNLDYFDEVRSLLLLVTEVQDHAADDDNKLLKLAITNGHLPITQQLLKIPAVLEYAANNKDALVELARKKEPYPGRYDKVVDQLERSAARHQKDTQETTTLIFSSATIPVKPESLPKASEPKKPPEIPSHPTH